MNSAQGSGILLFVLLQVQDLGFRFPHRWLFRHLEFALQSGDCLVVRGPNGSGKSTLLRVLSGLLKPSEGQVFSDSLAGYSALELGLYPALTVQEHLDLMADLVGPVPSKIIEQAGFGEHWNRQAGKLSSGLQSRLKLALAFAGNPPVLLLDETGVALDEAGKEWLRSCLLHQLSEGALIMATNESATLVQPHLELDLGE